MVVSIFLRVFAYGVPFILIVLGFIVYMGGELSQLIFETSEPSIISGLLLILGGVLILVTIFRFGIR